MTLGPLWRPRYWLARMLITLAMWIMPRCRYRTELNTAMWTLNLKVQANSAAKAVRNRDAMRDRANN